MSRQHPNPKGRATSPTAVQLREVLLAAGGGMVAVHSDGVLARLNTAALNDPSAGLLAVQVRPGTRRSSWLPADLHTALGVDQGLTGWGRPGEGDWSQVTVTVLAHRVGHIAVLDPWLLTPTLLGELLTNLQGTGAAIWLIGRGALSDDQLAVLNDWVAELTEPEVFRAAWADRPGLLTPPGTGTDPEHVPPTVAHSPNSLLGGFSPNRLVGEFSPSIPVGERATRGASDPWPHQLPDTDFTTFRATCRDQLTPEQFTAVDEHLRSTATTARHWLAAQLQRHALTDEETVARHLHQVWQDSPTVPHFVTAVRAYQVAAFSLGWFLQVDSKQLLGTAAVSPRRAARTPALWARLSGYASPHRGAVCALAASGIDIADQGDVLVESVTDAGHTLVLPTGRRVHVEDGAHHFLHAQKLARLLDGAPGDAPLLADPDGRPLTERPIANILATARLELGLNLTGTRAERRSPTGDRWYTRWGISIQELS